MAIQSVPGAVASAPTQPATAAPAAQVSVAATKDALAQSSVSSAAPAAAPAEKKGYFQSAKDWVVSKWNAFVEAVKRCFGRGTAEVEKKAEAAPAVAAAVDKRTMAEKLAAFVAALKNEGSTAKDLKDLFAGLGADAQKVINTALVVELVKTGVVDLAKQMDALIDSLFAPADADAAVKKRLADAREAIVKAVSVPADKHMRDQLIQEFGDAVYADDSAKAKEVFGRMPKALQKEIDAQRVRETADAEVRHSIQYGLPRAAFLDEATRRSLAQFSYVTAEARAAAAAAQAAAAAAAAQAAAVAAAPAAAAAAPAAAPAATAAAPAATAAAPAATAAAPAAAAAPAPAPAATAVAPAVAAQAARDVVAERRAARLAARAEAARLAAEEDAEEAAAAVAASARPRAAVHAPAPAPRVRVDRAAPAPASSASLAEIDANLEQTMRQMAALRASAAHAPAASV